MARIITFYIPASHRPKVRAKTGSGGAARIIFYNFAATRGRASVEARATAENHSVERPLRSNRVLNFFPGMAADRL
jgi:hypothetical protein